MQVFIPKGTYNGQKLNTLVRKKIPAKIISITARVPVIILAKYNPKMTNPIIILIVLSMVPMFFSILFVFIFRYITIHNEVSF